MTADLHRPELYSNRELSWLSFNARVLELARRTDVPLLERLKFVAIAASNLDEFFVVRVGRLEQRSEDRFEPGPDGLQHSELVTRIFDTARNLVTDASRVLMEDLLPQLAAKNVVFLRSESITPAIEASLQAYYLEEVQPCLTPLAIDPAHPFPRLKNHSLNLALRLEIDGRDRSPAQPAPHLGPLLALIQVPSMLPRFVPVEEPGNGILVFAALEEIIARYAGELFPGHRIQEARAFRVTRAGDLDIDEDEADDLLVSIQDQLRGRERGEPVRLEIESDASESLTRQLAGLIGVQERQIFKTGGYVDAAAFMKVLSAIPRPDLKDDHFVPTPSARFRFESDLFSTIHERDIALHHPYESFSHVVDFIDAAAEDARVVAIKQTLYRTSGDSPIVRALAQAAERGKEVTVIVELKARFDEANNIQWAKALEESGVHVVYSLIGFKTHSKMLLVIRREEEQLVRYLHLGTGNYNSSTARLYTDLGLFTAREDITHDAMLLFNVLTGYAELPELKRLIVSPFNLREHVNDAIDREIEHARAGRPSGIRAKMNALVDDRVIEHLYRASQAGVSVDLIVRGACCLRPGVPGISENIRVRSILDRFLEHARIFEWTNGGDTKVFLSSADWMPRNLNRRIEVCFPVLDPTIKRRISNEILPTEFSDNCHAWELGPDGTYRPKSPDGDAPFRAQAAFMTEARRRAHRHTSPLRPELSARKLNSLSPAVRAAVAQQRRHSRGP